jgi:hypothetical protein
VPIPLDTKGWPDWDNLTTAAKLLPWLDFDDPHSQRLRSHWRNLKLKPHQFGTLASDQRQRTRGRLASAMRVRKREALGLIQHGNYGETK